PRERLDWVALCRNTVERFGPRFDSAGLTLGFRPAVREAWILADGHRLEEVLENLLGNALRYVPRGGAVMLALEGVAAVTAPQHEAADSGNGSAPPARGPAFR